MRYSTYNHLRALDPAVARHRRLRRVSVISLFVALAAMFIYRHV